jgi:hypothetical protein
MPVTGPGHGIIKTPIWNPQKLTFSGIYLVYSRYMTTWFIYVIYTRYIYLSDDMKTKKYIPGIYQVYDFPGKKHILVCGIYLVYTTFLVPFSCTRYIPGIFLVYLFPRAESICPATESRLGSVHMHTDSGLQGV